MLIFIVRSYRGLYLYVLYVHELVFGPPDPTPTWFVRSCSLQPISYIETSAKEAVKVEGAFLEVVQLALINSAQQPPDMWVVDCRRDIFFLAVLYYVLSPFEVQELCNVMNYSTLVFFLSSCLAFVS